MMDNVQKKPLLHELHDLYSSSGIVRIVKSRRLQWAGHVAKMREMKNAYRIFMGKPLGKHSLGNL
jgi:hypothetical protein